MIHVNVNIDRTTKITVPKIGNKYIFPEMKLFPIPIFIYLIYRGPVKIEESSFYM